jgi:RNA polymerase sigma factor (TIGR02999 family)
MSDVTRILSMIDAGDQQASDELLPLVYEELRQLAASRMAGERADHTLQATALVHEAYLRLVGASGDQQWNSRGHFFAAAGEAMRRILVENARRKKRQRRGGDYRQVAQDIEGIADHDDRFDLLEINEVLNRLGERHPNLADVVKLRCFAGFSISEVAESLGIARSTAYENWTYAKVWLLRELREKSE